MVTLKQLRQLNGLTQKELADLFEVSDRTIYSLEKDSSNIRDSILKKYIKAFNVTYDDIFLGNEYENNVLSNEKKKKIIVRMKETPA